MGRGKLPLELITKEKSRRTTFEKRKKGLMKKTYELSTLCGVKVCLLIFDYNNPLAEPETFPSNAEQVRSLVNKFEADQTETKKNLTLHDFYRARLKKVKKEIEGNRAQEHNRQISDFPSWDDRLNGFSIDQLFELLNLMQNKIEALDQQIIMKNIMTQKSSIPVLDHHMIFDPYNYNPSLYSTLNNPPHFKNTENVPFGLNCSNAVVPDNSCSSMMDLLMNNKGYCGDVEDRNSSRSFSMYGNEKLKTPMEPWKLENINENEDVSFSKIMPIHSFLPQQFHQQFPSHHLRHSIMPNYSTSSSSSDHKQFQRFHYGFEYYPYDYSHTTSGFN
uniref:MADS92 n=1 Tax=Hippophae rhamnoides TaxID=193516 RepID=A0AAU7LJK3_9ROSA